MITSIRTKSNYTLIKEIKIENKLTLLYGCNGVGKSTFLREVNTVINGGKLDNVTFDEETTLKIKKIREDDAKDTKFKFGEKLSEIYEKYGIYYYTNRHENFERVDPQDTSRCDDFMEAMGRRGAAMSRSEGQNVLMSFLSWIDNISVKDGSTIVIDEIDSGLSVEHVNIICHVISDLIRTKRLQVIVAINNYHWFYHFNKTPNIGIIDMSTGNKIKFDDYKDFLKFTVDTSQKVFKLKEKNFKKEGIINE